MNSASGLAERQIIIQCGHLNTDRRVTEAQLREALTLIEAELRVDHAYSFRRHKFAKSRRQQDFAPTETHISNPHAMFDILASTLDGITRVYLIIDIDSLSSFPEKIAWPSSILTMFRKLADHGSQSNVKVMLVSYTANTFLKVSDPEICERVIR